MKGYQAFVAWAPLLTLMLTVSVGCASGPKPVSCDGHLEPINKPALPANAGPLGSPPQSAASTPPVPAVQAGSDNP